MNLPDFPVISELHRLAYMIRNLLMLSSILGLGLLLLGFRPPSTPSLTTAYSISAHHPAALVPGGDESEKVLASTSGTKISVEGIEWLAEAGLSLDAHHLQEYLHFEDRQLMPQRDVFLLAYTGYEQLLRQGKLQNSRYLTVVDFRIPSNSERLWVLDMEEHRIVQRSLVAHGVNSGELYATKFSDTPQSFQSSPGFYLANELYIGKHGLSLRLDGMEKGINGNARDRAIVIHGADYVSPEFIQRHGRLGRSQGCPALPLGQSESIIRTITGQSCLFILVPDKNYIKRSPIIRSLSSSGGMG